MFHNKINIILGLVTQVVSKLYLGKDIGDLSHFSFFFLFLKLFKNIKPFLAWRLYKNMQFVGPSEY